MKILCLLDSPVKAHDRWIWDAVPGNRDQVDFLFTQSRDRYKKWGKILWYYPSYFSLALRALRMTRQQHYDAVMAWEGKNGFPYAMLRRLSRQQHPPLVIFNFIYRGLVRQARSLAEYTLKRVDHITVTTRYEEAAYRKLFRLPEKRVSLVYFGGYDTFKIAPTVPEAPEKPFILASGRSHRDYATLVQAVDGLSIPLTIVARRFNLNGIRLPENVRTCDLLPMKDYCQMLRQAAFQVVPLAPVQHAAGDISMVQGMSAGKANIVTASPSADTYMEDGVTGLVVPPGDARAMRDAIVRLWEQPREAEQMGMNGRSRYCEHFSFERMAQNIVSTLEDVVHEA